VQKLTRYEEEVELLLQRGTQLAFKGTRKQTFPHPTVHGKTIESTVAIFDLVGSMNEAQVTEGGPGSGHHGHRGIPGYQGGSMAQGPVMFLPKRLAKQEYKTAAGRWGTETDHMKAYAESEGQEWAEGLSQEERDIAKAYTGSYGYAMNDCLRRNEGCSESRYESIATLKQALDRGEASEDMVVYRGADWGRLKELEPGDTFVDNGFASCSANATKATNFGETLMEIEVPEGTKGAWLQNISGFDEEVEFLMQRGARFAVVGKRKITLPGDPYIEGDTVTKEVLRVQVVP